MKSKHLKNKYNTGPLRCVKAPCLYLNSVQPSVCQRCDSSSASSRLQQHTGALNHQSLDRLRGQTKTPTLNTFSSVGLDSLILPEIRWEGRWPGVTEVGLTRLLQFEAHTQATTAIPHLICRQISHPPLGLGDGQVSDVGLQILTVHGSWIARKNNSNISNRQHFKSVLRFHRIP